MFIIEGCVWSSYEGLVILASHDASSKYPGAEASTCLSIHEFIYDLLIHVLLLTLRIFVLQVFYDSFDENFEGRWVVSQSSDYGGTTIVPISLS